MSTKEEKDKDPYMWRLVRTTESKTDDWTTEGKLARKWNIEGKITDLSNSHGLCYQVRHQDETLAWYDPSELEFIDDINEPGWDPKETMGPGRKPGDARKAC